MSATPAKAADPQEGVLIRHPEMAARIEKAMDNNPHAPAARGRLAWVVREFKTRFNVDVTREAVRRWTTGMTAPRGETREQLAQVLGVNSTWMMTGYDPTGALSTTRATTENAAADVLAGLLKMSGWGVAVPDSRRVDIRASLGGRHYDFEVKAALPQGEGAFLYQVPRDTDGLVLLALVRKEAFGFDLLEVRGEPGAKVAIQKVGDGYRADGAEVVQIHDLSRPI